MNCARLVTTRYNICVRLVVHEPCQPLRANSADSHLQLELVAKLACLLVTKLDHLNHALVLISCNHWR